jgi:hypothetical protein
MGKLPLTDMASENIEVTQNDAKTEIQVTRDAGDPAQIASWLIRAALDDVKAGSVRATILHPPEGAGTRGLEPTEPEPPEPEPQDISLKPGTRKREIARWLSENGPATNPEIQEGTEIPAGTVGSALTQSPAFRKIDETRPAQYELTDAAREKLDSQLSDSKDDIGGP